MVGDPSVSPNEIALPALILWNPFVSFSQVLRLQNKKCATCGMAMHESAWTDGSTSDTQPRSIHGFDRKYFLVSAIYVCDTNHRTLAHDPSILAMFPTQHLIPFVLFHRTGFTQELASLCTTLVSRGMTMLEIESLIIQRRWETHAMEQNLMSLHAITTHTNYIEEQFIHSYLSDTPSNNLITKCFLATFLHNEQTYAKEMLSVKVGASITWDHTFKVATNIGYLRSDNVWVPVYDSLFIVMNNEGDIVCWQLTRGTCFSQIEQSLRSLRIRSQQQNCRITTVYVDDCCKLRNKIKSILGEEIVVKLDVFHAIQRVTKTMSKKNNRFQKCMDDLRLVFRQNGDSEHTRKCNTPSPDEINQKMEAFVAKWKNIKSSNTDNRLLFSSETIHAIDCLKRHITRGCLSDIPPHSGTNRNEKFHSFINSKLHRSRIGIFLAYALLTVFMYCHNNSSKIHGKLLIRPIAASPLQSTANDKTLPIFGICPKVREERLESTSFTIDISQSSIDLELVRSMYTTSLYKYYLLKSIQSMKLDRMKQSVFNFKPFTISQDGGAPSGAYMCNKTPSRLEEYGLRRIEIAKDGNCFFMSIATILSRSKDLGQRICSDIAASMQTYTPITAFGYGLTTLKLPPPALS